MCKHKRKMKPSGSNYVKFRSSIPILRVANPLKKFQHKPCKCERKGCNISPGMKAELEDMDRHRSPKQSQLMSVSINVRRKMKSFHHRRNKCQAYYFTYYLCVQGRKLRTCKETIKQIFGGKTELEIKSRQRKLKTDLKSWKRRDEEKRMCIRAANSIKRRYAKQVTFDMCHIPDFPTPPTSPLHVTQHPQLPSIQDDDDLLRHLSIFEGAEKTVQRTPVIVSQPTERPSLKRHHYYCDEETIVAEMVAKKSKPGIVGSSDEVAGASSEASETRVTAKTLKEVFIPLAPWKEKAGCVICEELEGRMRSGQGESEHEELRHQLYRHQSQAQAALKSYTYDMSRIRTEKKKALVVMGIELQKIIFTAELNSSLRNYSDTSKSSELSDRGSTTTVPEETLLGGTSLTDTLWSDEDTETGTNEISSCLWKYFSKYKPLEPGERRELILWTETCSGQSMNFIILALLILSVRKKFFSSVCHKMFYPGHSIFPDEEEQPRNNFPTQPHPPLQSNHKPTYDYETQSNKIDSTCQPLDDDDDDDDSDNPVSLPHPYNAHTSNGNNCELIARSEISSPPQRQEAHATSDVKILTMEEKDFLDFKKVYQLIGCPTTLNISGELCLKYDQDRSGILMSKNQHLLDRWKDHTLPNYTKKTEKRRTTLQWNWEKIDDFTPPKLFSEAVLQEIHKNIPKDFQKFYVDMLKYSKDFDQLYSGIYKSNSPTESPKLLETIQDLEESLLLLQDADSRWDENLLLEHQI